MSSIDSPLKVSIVAPCYNEEEVIEEFSRRALAAARKVADGSFEVVLVDDGSRDATWSKIEALSAEFPEIVGVRLMRNHGHELASTAGIASSRGARILLIDADLQDPPELLGDMMAMMDRGADVVYGQRGIRKGESWMKLTTSAVFYRLLRWLASVDIPSDTGDFRLMTRRVAELLLSMPERDRFLRGMISWIGGRQVPIVYERDQRYAGTTKYSYSKLFRLALDAITAVADRLLGRRGHGPDCPRAAVLHLLQLGGRLGGHGLVEHHGGDHRFQRRAADHARDSRRICRASCPAEQGTPAFHGRPHDPRRRGGVPA